MDVSELLKSSFQNLHKAKPGFDNLTAAFRARELNNRRRETRDTLRYLRRQIDENLSPVLTPVSNTKKEKKKVVPVKSKAQMECEKRLELLKKWKEEQKKKRDEQKSKAKPLFKVTHAPSEFGYPNLDFRNKTKNNDKYQFAPSHYKFKGPSNLTTSNQSNLRLNSASTSRNVISKTSQRNKVQINTRNETPKKSHKVYKKTPAKSVKLPIEHTNSRISTPKSNALKLEKQSNTEALEHLSQNSSKIQNDAPSTIVGSTRKKKLHLNEKNSVPRKSLRLRRAHSVCKCDDEPAHEDADRNDRLSTEIKDLSHTENQFNDKRTTRYDKKSLSHDNLKTINKTPRKSLRTHTKNKASSSSDSDMKFNECESTENLSNKKKTRKRMNKKTHIGDKNNITQTPSNSARSKDKIKGNSSNIKKNVSTVNSTGSFLYSEVSKTPRKSIRSLKKEIKRISLNDEDSTNKVNTAGRFSNSEANKVSVTLKNDVCKRITRSSKQIMPNVNDVVYKREVFRKSRKRNGKMPTAGLSGSQSSICDSNNSVFLSNDDKISTDSNVSKTIVKTSSSSMSSAYTIGDMENSPLNQSVEHSAKSCANSIEKTPKNKENPVVYISPFVTISRGKNSARKEFYTRKSKGGAFDSSPDILNSTGPRAGAAYFHRLLDKEIERIQSLCDEWNMYKEEQNPPEEACDLINVAVGQSQLLLGKKFKQFRNLIYSCENSDISEQRVTCEDLHGYWDTAYIQVENLNKRFKNIESLRDNNWEEILPEKKPNEVKRKVVTKKLKTQATSKLRDAIRATREKAMSQKAQILRNGKPVDLEADVKVFDRKFFAARSPSKKSPIIKNQTPGRLVITPNQSRKGLLALVLSNEAKRRISSPGLAVITAAQIAKSVDSNEVIITPARSILKPSNSIKSSIKKSKSVLFDDKNMRDDLALTSPPDLENSSFMSCEKFNRRSSTRRLTRNKLF